MAIPTLQMIGQSIFMPVIRRIVQAVSLVALNSSWAGGQVKWFCLPVMNCHSCSLAWFACPIGVMVHYAGYRVFPFLALGMLVLTGALLGRFLCGWVCPMGFLQDLLYKIPGRKRALPDWTKYIKYVLLAVTVVLLPFLLGETTLWSYCRGCPVSAMQATLPNLLGGGGEGLPLRTVVKLAILVAVLLLAVVSSRGFCRVLCPIGALLAPFNLLSWWRVKPVAGCVGCKKCDTTCPTQCAPSPGMIAHQPPSRQAECVVCSDCRTRCPVRKKTPAGRGKDSFASPADNMVKDQT
jgi:ferredoxin-type protein NapH